MMKKKLLKVLILFLVIFIVILPFYLLRSYFVLGYKILKPDYSKLKTDSGVTSILVLGKGGEGHTAPDLTDTIIDIFVSQDKGKISLLSIPRDIWIPETRAKINSSYYWDKQKGNSNYELTRSSVKSVTGINPSYIVIVDFNMFEDLVNALGGINVDVENSFTDNHFPIEGKENDLCNGDRTYACRYETISFEKGVQLMDGETALKFVRSRNADGDEGTDLAREARQQKVIDAIVAKAASSETLLKPQRISNIFNSVISNIETDIDTDAALALAKVLYDLRQNVQNLAIPEDYLIVSNGSYKYDYQYVFLPRSGNWLILMTWISSSLR